MDRYEFNLLPANRFYCPANGFVNVMEFQITKYLCVRFAGYHLQYLRAFAYKKFQPDFKHADLIFKQGDIGFCLSQRGKIKWKDYSFMGEKGSGFGHISYAIFQNSLTSFSREEMVGLFILSMSKGIKEEFNFSYLWEDMP
jgi:hypothetical protein